MEKLPLEVLAGVLGFLDPSDRYNCSLVCRSFLRALGRQLPAAKSLRVQVSDCSCTAGHGGDQAWVSMCQCEEHAAIHILKELLPLIAQEVTSLELDDDLAQSHICDDSVHTLLSLCGSSPLTRLALSRCDLAKVHPWTLALLAQYTNLSELAMLDCKLPLSESQLIRSMASSFATLNTLELTHCNLVTDKLARSVSRACPQLEQFIVDGCRAVSALSALALIETAALRTRHMLTMHVENTGFSAQKLDQLMCSPLFHIRDDWRLRWTTIELGRERSAVLAEQRGARCVLIYV